MPYASTIQLLISITRALANSDVEAASGLLLQTIEYRMRRNWSRDNVIIMLFRGDDHRRRLQLKIRAINTSVSFEIKNVKKKCSN